MVLLVSEEEGLGETAASTDDQVKSVSSGGRSNGERMSLERSKLVHRDVDVLAGLPMDVTEGRLEVERKLDGVARQDSSSSNDMLSILVAVESVPEPDDRGSNAVRTAASVVEVQENDTSDQEPDMGVEEDLIRFVTSRGERGDQDDQESKTRKTTADTDARRTSNLFLEGASVERVGNDVTNSGDADNTSGVTMENVVSLVGPASPLNEKTSLGAEQEHDGDVDNRNKTETVAENRSSIELSTSSGRGCEAMLFSMCCVQKSENHLAKKQISKTKK